jgi:hypothetical protein
MAEFLRKSLLVSFLFMSVNVYADPPIWDTEFGDDTGLVADDDYTIELLDFQFPFAGVDYNTIAINSNGGVVLAIDEIFDGDEYIDYDIWDVDYFESDFTDQGNPSILPFNTDLDNLDGDTGTIYFKSDGTTATITWEDMATNQNDTLPFVTFQLMLASDGTITFGYYGIFGDLLEDLDEGIVVGISNGDGQTPPISSDLSGPVNADPASSTVYEIWCYDEDNLVWGDGSCYTPDEGAPTRPDNAPFDLATRNVVFTPNASGGFDVAFMESPRPGPNEALVPYEISGCTLGRPDGTVDPTLPLLVLVSLAMILNSRARKARIQG